MNALIPKEQLQHLSSAELRAIALDTDIFLLKIEARQGEDYHSSFKKDPALFKKFLKTTVQMQDNIYAFFLDQKTRLTTLVNIYKLKADDDEDLDIWFNSIQWEHEDQTLSGTLMIDIEKFFDIGIEMATLALGSAIDISSISTPQQAFLREYSLKLAGNINQTSINRMKQQIQTSLDMGETRDKLTQRLTSIIDNEKRAEMIAQTESVRAFTQGRLDYGKALGWKGKEWRVAPGACDICLSFAKLGIIAVDKPFVSGKISVMGAPAHPRCRCGVKLHKTIDDKTEEDYVPTIDPFKVNEDFFQYLNSSV